MAQHNILLEINKVGTYLIINSYLLPATTYKQWQQNVDSVATVMANGSEI